MSRKIIEWSSRRMRRRAGPVQVTRWYRALTPNRADTDTAYTATATAALVVAASSTSSAPLPSETKKAYWWNTPRRRGLTRTSAPTSAGAGAPPEAVRGKPSDDTGTLRQIALQQASGALVGSTRPAATDRPNAWRASEAISAGVDAADPGGLRCLRAACGRAPRYRRLGDTLPYAPHPAVP